MLKRASKAVAVALAATVAIIQFFQIDRTNPPINAADTLEAAVSVPPDISMILGRSCNDCHSNKTTYPWYSYLQPSGWFLKSHIDDGRRELNFSQFNTYAARRKRRKLEEICSEVREGHMPLPSYLWVHRSAAVAPSEIEAICDWANKARDAIPE
jgi:hypothetical protein